METGKKIRRFITPGAFAFGLILGLSGCTNPYDPGQRAPSAVAWIGAGRGGAIGAAAGGGASAAADAAIGGAVGAVTGAATTPQAPPRY